MTITSTVVWRIIPGIVLALASVVGWFASHEFPVAAVFATVIPLSKGILPPTIVGHGKMEGTPKVPDDLAPQSRPENELFLDLPGGYKFPQNGIGMCCRATAYDDVLVYRSVLWYLLLGGRHIDGAHLYLNHVAIGKAIAEAVRRGVDREEIFVTTKVFPTHFGYESTMTNVQNYLDDLGLNYIDLVLIHFPTVPVLSSPCKKEGKSPAECRMETWKALSDMRQKGLIRNAGVSNFSKKHIQELEGVGAPIANNQIQFHPFEPDYVQETVDYCQTRGITITAYSPLGGMMDKDRALANEVINKLSTKHGKRASQIMLRWAIQRGCAVIPGTGNPDHMKENLGVYGFKLSDDDMETINQLKQDAKGYSSVDVRSFA